MLNPEQAGRLRTLVRDGRDFSYFEGFRIDRAEVIVRPDEAAIEAIYHEQNGSAEMVGATHLFGAPHDTSCLQGVSNYKLSLGEKRLYRLLNARIVGNCGVIGEFGLAAPSPILSGEPLEKFLLRNQLNFQGFLLERHLTDGKLYSFFVSGGSPEVRQGCGLFIHNIEPGNYGSFLFRVLPQMMFLAEQDDLAFDFYVTPARTSWFMEAIELVGLPERPVFTVGELAGDQIRSLLICNEFDNEGWYDETTLRLLNRLTRRIVAGRGRFIPGGRKLYVSRRLGHGYRPNYRRLLNEDEVASVMIESGFEVIYPETLRFAEQIFAFAGAEYLAGPSGSGMLNAIFARSGTKVLDLESFQVTVRQHAKIYASTMKNYSFLFGKLAENDRPAAAANWLVDLSLLKEALSWFSEC